MIKNSTIFQKLSVLPDNFKAEEICWLVDSQNVSIFSDQRLKWHYSFSIGFFGFHYIRAANENDAVLRCESLKILRMLIAECDLNSVYLRGLKEPDKHSYWEFWEKRIRPVSLALGDVFGQGTQETAKLGYWLAAVNASLVGELSGRKDETFADRQAILSRCLSELKDSSQQSDIPDLLKIKLNELTELLQRPQTPSSPRKCLEKLKLVHRYFLLTETSR